MVRRSIVCAPSAIAMKSSRCAFRVCRMPVGLKFS
jgi:hypothetical protein